MNENEVVRIVRKAEANDLHLDAYAQRILREQGTIDGMDPDEWIDALTME